MTELLDNGSRETTMLRNFGVAYGIQVPFVLRHLTHHVRTRHAQYRREREHAEWIDVGGEG